MPKFYHRATNILSILKLQDRIYLAGGTYAHAHQYRSLNKQIKMLLERAGLDYTKENIRQVLSFPFDPSFDVKDICNPTVCERNACRIRSQFLDEVACCALVMDYRPFDISIRVMNIKNNIEVLRMGDDGII